MLEEKGLAYRFSDDTGMYEVYRIRGWEKQDPRDFLVSVPAQVARRNVAEAHDLIRTALDLQNLFGS
jgi:hypothetical protein